MYIYICIYYLLNIIDRKLKGLKYWKGLTDQDRENIKKQIKKQNLDLDVSDMNVPDLSVFTYKVIALHVMLLIL